MYCVKISLAGCADETTLGPGSDLYSSISVGAVNPGPDLCVALQDKGIRKVVPVVFSHRYHEDVRRNSLQEFPRTGRAAPMVWGFQDMGLDRTSCIRDVIFCGYFDIAGQQKGGFVVSDAQHQGKIIAVAGREGPGPLWMDDLYPHCPPCKNITSIQFPDGQLRWQELHCLPINWILRVAEGLPKLSHSKVS